MQQPGNSQQEGSQGGKPALSWTAPQQKTPAPQTPQTPKATPPKMNTEKSNMGTYSSIFIGGLVVGVLIGWGVVSSHGGSTTAMTDNSSASTATTTATGGVDLSDSMMGVEGLTIPSPQDAGFGVTVSHVSASEPTWLVVYDDNNGTAGKALGAALFLSAAQGGDTSGTISLLRATLSGQSYLVGESIDNGDHQFSTTSDKPVVDEKGNPVLTEFKTN